MRVNLDGAFYTAQAAGRLFKKQGKGNVIFTASVSAILVNIPQKQAAVSDLLLILIWENGFLDTCLLRENGLKP